LPLGIITCPSVASNLLQIIFSKVDFPAPFLPVNPILSFSFIKNEIFLYQFDFPLYTICYTSKKRYQLAYLE
jgi:hypothetical protein